MLVKPFSLDYNINFTTTNSINNNKVALSPVIEIKATFKNNLILALINYWRWIAEGKKPSSRATSYAKGSQSYYDNYTDNIEYLPETDTYSYRIKTDDSSEGDTWVSGTFKIIFTFSNIDIEILSQTTIVS